MTRRCRFRFTAAGTSSTIAAAAVPSSCEYVKTPTWSNSIGLDEVHEFVDVGLGLAGEADHERGPQRHARQRVPEVREQRLVTAARAGTAHALEHRRRRVLQRQIDVAHHFFARRHGVNRLGRDRGRVEVEQPDPLEAVDGIQRPQQPAERTAILPVAIDAVEGRVLGDEQQFLDAARGQRACFGHDRRLVAAAVRATQFRDDAERAVVIAAFRDLHVGVVAGRGEPAGRGGVVQVGREYVGLAMPGRRVAGLRPWAFGLRNAAPPTPSRFAGTRAAGPGSPRVRPRYAGTGPPWPVQRTGRRWRRRCDRPRRCRAPRRSRESASRNSSR